MNERQDQAFVVIPQPGLVGPAEAGIVPGSPLARRRCRKACLGHAVLSSGRITPLRRITLEKSARSPVAMMVCADLMRG